MTFDAIETSMDLGEPILLFDFSTGFAHWRYTTADRPITVSAVEYDPLAIVAANIIQGQELRQKTIKVTVPRDCILVQQLQGYPPSTDLLLTIYAMHYSDPAAQTPVAWIGRVKSQNQKNSVVELSCEPGYTGIQTVGLRRRWQINCPHVLYGPGCELPSANFKVPATLTAVSQFTINSPQFILPAGLSFAGGYVEWDSGHGYLERRTINSAAATALTLAYGSPDLADGLAVTAFPGCDHTTATCKAFKNILNYGGDPWIPLKNPMDGNPVY